MLLWYVTVSEKPLWQWLLSHVGEERPREQCEKRERSKLTHILQEEIVMMIVKIEVRHPAEVLMKVIHLLANLRAKEIALIKMMLDHFHQLNPIP